MKRHPIAVLDACVLVPMPLADTLLRLSEPPALFAARWSDEILQEVTRTLEGRFGMPADKVRYREASMRAFFPGSLVRDYNQLTTTMRNHPKDRHVLAAALACKADYLVTFNLKDFPASTVPKLGPAMVGPSTFLKQIWTLNPVVVELRLEQQADAIGVSLDLLLDRLAKSVPGFVNAVRPPASGKI